MLKHRCGIISIVARGVRSIISGSTVTLVLVLACGSPVFAQDPSSPQYEVSGFVGTSLAPDFQVSILTGNPQQATRNVGVHYGAGYQIGVRLTENVNDSWDTTLEYSFANHP